MGQFSKLEAVNRILRGAAEMPVSSLEEEQVNETLMAEQVLDEISIQEQMHGLNCNTVVTVLSPDVDNHILLPDATLAVYAWYMQDGGVNSIGENFSTRNSPELRLFDVTNNTDEFEDDVCVKYTLLMEFEDLPTAIQFAITDIAAQIYQMTVQGDRVMNDLLGAMAAYSRARAKAADMRSVRANLFTTGRSLGPRMARRVPRSWW